MALSTSSNISIILPILFAKLTKTSAIAVATLGPGDGILHHQIMYLNRGLIFQGTDHSARHTDGQSHPATQRSASHCQ